MTIADISITGAGVVESTIIYGIVHGIWTGVKWFIKQLRTETGKVIEEHVKSGHESRFKRCIEGKCASLLLGTEKGSLHQLEQ